MDDPNQARAYSEADFSESHQAFVELFRQRFPRLAAESFRAIDLGCGPADVTVRFARAHPLASIVAIDGAAAMLDLARARLKGAKLDGRVELLPIHLPDARLDGMTFDVSVSNSLLHHLHDPQVMWQSLRACTSPSGAVFVMDLCRPPGDADVDRLVDQYAGVAPEILKRDFRSSLRAAYRVDEVREQLLHAGLSLRVEQTTDRHLIAWGTV